MSFLNPSVFLLRATLVALIARGGKSSGNIIFENSNEDNVSIEDLFFLMFQLKLVNFVKTFY